MTILLCVILGAGAGWLVYRASGYSAHATSSVAVGVLGALLGLATEVWLASRGAGMPVTSYAAAATGSAALLTLYTVAQRLFLAPPGADPRKVRPRSG